MESVILLLNRVAEGWWNWMVPMAWQVVVLAAPVFVLSLLARGTSPRFRYLLWCLVFVKVCLPPSLTLPTGIGHWLQEPVPNLGTAPQGPSPQMHLMPPRSSYPPRPVSTVAESKPPSVQLSRQGVFFCIWLAGLAMLGSALIAQYMRLRRLLREGMPVEHPQVLALFAECQRTLGIGSRIDLVSVDHVKSPILFGLLRPQIVLPRTALANMSSADLKPILLHELAHLRAHDLWINWGRAILQTIYWFHPLVWLAHLRMRHERELLIDDVVLMHLHGEANAYGASLVRILKQSTQPRLLTPGFVGIFENSVVHRLRRILDTERRLSVRLSWLSVSALLVVAIVLIPQAKTELTSAEQQNAGQNPTTHSEESSPSRDMPQTITIHLPDLPKDAKRLEVVFIQPGTFTMGAPLDERGRRDEYDWPSHSVTITRPFYVGKYEVTQAQWEAVMGKATHHSRFHGNNNPVEKVSWKHCQRFVERLNALGQGGFRLPTEAEWEYACRAGTETRFSFGDALECADIGKESCEVANTYMWWAGNNNLHGTKEVGLKLPNPWGLYDMHGNVSEWCSDLWEAPYDRGPQIDPKGPPSNWLNRLWPLSNHVFRGGSSYYGGDFRGARECRSASRHYEQAFDYHYSLGFRLVREYP